MVDSLYAETLLAPGLGISFQWRYQNNGRGLLSVIDPESPVRGALGQAIERFENTVFELTLNKPTLIEWANSQETLQDAADTRELRLGGAHVFQQSIELLQGMQMMTDREEDPARLSAIHQHIGDVMGLIGQRSGSVHFLEQAVLSYEQALEIRSREEVPLEWARSTFNTGVALQAIGELEDDTALLKQALNLCKEAVNGIPREEGADEWAAAMCRIGTVLYQLGVHRRGARTLEQAVVALRNALGMRDVDSNLHGWLLTRNNLAATLQALGEHEEDIGSLEASLPLYDEVLKVLSDGSLPLIRAMVSANRASAMSALAGESGHLEMAESSIAEFRSIHDLLQGTDYANYRNKALERAEQADALVAALQV